MQYKHKKYIRKADPDISTAYQTRGHYTKAISLAGDNRDA
jgi:hypothetical protein